MTHTHTQYEVTPVLTDPKPKLLSNSSQKPATLRKAPLLVWIVYPDVSMRSLRSWAALLAPQAPESVAFGAWCFNWSMWVSVWNSHFRSPVRTLAVKVSS